MSSIVNHAWDRLLIKQQNVTMCCNKPLAQSGGSVSMSCIRKNRWVIRREEMWMLVWMQRTKNGCIWHTISFFIHHDLQISDHAYAHARTHKHTNMHHYLLGSDAHLFSLQQRHFVSGSNSSGSTTVWQYLCVYRCHATPVCPFPHTQSADILWLVYLSHVVFWIRKVPITDRWIIQLCFLGLKNSMRKLSYNGVF